LIKHSEVADPQISGPAQTNILLQNATAHFAQLAQAGISWKHHSLIRWQWIMPGLTSGHISNPMGQLFVVQGRPARIEAGELLKLNHRPAHHETAPGIPLRFLLLRSFATDMR